MSVRTKRALAFGGVLTLAFACAPLKVDSRNLFADLTYKNDGPPPDPALAFHLYASLEIEAVTTYRAPKEVAKCFRALEEPWLRAAGAALSAAHSLNANSPDSWGRIAAENTKTLPDACKDAFASDKVLVAYETSRIATTVLAYARTTTASTCGDAQVYAAAIEALKRIATLLEATPDQPVANPFIAAAPALALSGGSANGAFVAGFMFELLWARERALSKIQKPDDRRRADLESRFSALVGTSVGSLISQLLDFYFVDPTVPLTDAQKGALAECARYTQTPCPSSLGCGMGGACDKPCAQSCGDHPGFDGWPDATFPSFDAATLAARPLQQCALTYMFRYFTDDDEPTLMCVEPGPITGAIGALGRAHPNLVRFDPMTRNIIDKVLRPFGTLIANNETTRVVVSVETQQNQTLGLDERACRMLPSMPGTDGVLPQGGLEYCLSSGVMASVVLPFFARPLRHTYSGYSQQGECGTWLDGGLRSGFPALRALRLTRPTHALRVLAIDTGRLDGMPNTRPSMIHEVALNAIGQMGNQSDVYEVVMAQQFANERDHDVKAIKEALGVVEHDAVPNPQDDWSVMPVFVPTDAPPALVAQAGYAFDRYVMRGLWTWGRRVAMRRMLGADANGVANHDRELARVLGWNGIADELRDLARDDQSDAVLSKWFDAYRLPECPSFRERHRVAGKGRILNEGEGGVEACAEPDDPGPKTPKYFVCPSNAGEPR